MSKNTLYDKVFEKYTIGTLPNGQTQLFIDTHLIHEVTSPQGFTTLRDKNISMLFKDRTFATVDHIIPTEKFTSESIKDTLARKMYDTLCANTKEHGLPFFNRGSNKQGIVHVVAPELGITKPGITMVCGDSHTSTHGAFGAIAFGVGSTEVGFVLATQSLPVKRLKVRKVEFTGTLKAGVGAKDLVLFMTAKLGVQGGVGYAYEYSGEVISSMSMEGRLTLCNMSIEAGARVGYVNPDETTFDYLKNREFSPKGEKWEQAVAHWREISSSVNAEYDDIVTFDVNDLEPVVTFGINPSQAISLGENTPTADSAELQDAYKYMDLRENASLVGVTIDVAFLGSCTNSRIEDLREGASIIQKSNKKVANSVEFLVVPGSEAVKAQAEKEGLDKIFLGAGASWREPGCSMCLGMNPDKLVGGQRCISSSNRNFKGRQGSSTGKTHLASPSVVVASALYGKIVNPRVEGLI